MASLLLDRTTWDLVLDAAGNIAAATEPYSLAQDAASAVRTWLGEVYFDTTLGVDWRSILGEKPQVALIKQKMVDTALTVPGVASARCVLTAVSGRSVSGQVQVTSAAGQTSAASFAVVIPQGP